MSRFDEAIAAFDTANARDPHTVAVDGREVPKELRYGQRMSAFLVATYPDASEALRLAARCQHIRRWESPRSDYPEGRVGYLKWRADLKKFHADAAGEILQQVGYDANMVARVGQLLRKEKLKQDADVQRLEDIACLVFLEDHLSEFAPKYDEAKVVDIIVKTWKKMSPEGHEAALALKLPPAAARLVGLALTQAGVQSAD